MMCTFLLLLCLSIASVVKAETSSTLFKNVKVFDGASNQLSPVTNVLALKMLTHDNADLLALSGNRNPYPGKLGVIEKGALADVLLVDGDPTASLKLFSNPQKSLLVIMKDGKIHKNLAR